MTRAEHARKAEVALPLRSNETGSGARAITRRFACVAITACLLSACADAPAPSNSQRGIRRCDRNGDLEERLACQN